MTIFAIILAVVYFLVGVPKLLGVKPLADQFEEFGLGAVAMRSVGALEVAAGVGMLLDSVRIIAALGMAAMTIGAVVFHRRVEHPVQSYVPAVVVLLASISFVALSV